MSLKTTDVDRIHKKLEMETREGRDKLAWFVYNGKRVLFTRRSHGRGDIPGRIADFIRQQLKLNDREFANLRDCFLKREGYIDLLRKKGHLP
jgi:hypothetical protein